MSAPVFSLRQCLEAYLEDRRTRHYSENTLAKYREHVGRFIHWAWQQGVLNPADLSGAVLHAYQRYLLDYRHPTRGTALSPLTRHGLLVRVQTFLHWLARQGLIPPLTMTLPKAERPLPRVLSVSEMERLLHTVDVQVPFGVRDRAMLETLYATGVRGGELARLCQEDLELDSGWLMVRQGKGQKDRRVPLGERAVDWLTQHLRDERPRSRGAKQHEEVFLTHLGVPYGAKGVSGLVNRTLKKAGLGERGGSHLIRHSMATHMLQNGADIRFSQVMLGHNDLASTQIYTRVLDPALKAVHTAAHPARLRVEEAETGGREA